VVGDPTILDEQTAKDARDAKGAKDNLGQHFLEHLRVL